MSPTSDLSSTDLAPLGYALLLVAFVWSLRSAREEFSGCQLGWRWWALVGGVLLAFRWALLWLPHQLNPDESQLIAGAITLRHDPVFWRSVDGGTAGPLAYYPLLPAAWVDGAASFTLARVISLAAILASLVLAGETIALIAGAAVARVAVLPALTFYSLTTNPDFLHCSTEVMPLLAVSAAAWLAVRSSTSPSRAGLWLVALLLGAAPWAKLQAIPLAAALWAVIVWRESRPGRPPALLPLLAGALLPSLAAFAFAAATGQLEHLVVPFFLNNLAYARAPQFSWAANTLAQAHNALLDGYAALGVAGVILFAAGALLRWRAAPDRLRRAGLLALGLLAAAALSALGPRRPSLHHLQFLILPLIWLGGTALAIAWEGARRPVIAGVFLLVGAAPLVAWRATGPATFDALHATPRSGERRQLPELVRHFSTPREPLAIWGWRTSLYVEAGRRQATRQAHTEAQILPGPWQRYFLRRYFEDFQAASPPVFADAVGPGNFAFVDPHHVHETFPPLRAWVRARYTLLATVDGVRLFVRNDRLAAAKLALPAPSTP